ncbi:ABC transporter permease [Nocardioides carbamazepini]|jgi:ABC-type nitrate/sulfonate/bicarbonate transport system permease component|uniref:ABC transporter permease n=1 Tax=Nocardioides carbamazepini TaxID=2854259 RepID=UPI00214A3B29|nr:ABC transporter permease [Nocardioides carbamazepini]MCR1784391.1 ABC transporter permease [Nocardioides carbamazepini]
MSATTAERVDAPGADETGIAARPRPTRRWRSAVNLRGLVFAIGLVLLLELLTATVVSSVYVPRPSEIGEALVSELQRGDLMSGIGITLGAYLQGLAIAAVAGVVLGAALGASELAYQTFRILIEFLRPLPSVALIPFSILLLGVGTTTTVAMIVFASFWPILFNTYYGVRAVNPVAIESARIFGLSRRQVFFRVQIPSAAVNIAAGIRISSAIALILVITVEILTRSGGLGYYIVRMQVAIRTEDMYAGIFVVGVIGYIVALAVAGLERRVIFWNSDIREGGDR